MCMNLANRQISVWGDSILKGVILDDTDGRYRVLENNCVTGFQKITGSIITNHASFGMTTGKAYARMQQSTFRNQPKSDDIVLIEFGGNDCDYNWAEVSSDPLALHLPKTPMEQFSLTLQSIIDLFKGFSIKPVFMALPPLEPVKYFKWISRNLNPKNILGWLGDINRIYRWQEAYSDIVKQTASLNNLKIINVRENFLTCPDYSSKFCTDGIHPNEAGHEIILETLLSYVK